MRLECSWYGRAFYFTGWIKGCIWKRKTSQLRIAVVLFSRAGMGLFQCLKEPAHGTRLCFRVGSQARGLLLYPGDPGLLVMLLLITGARCLSEGWLGIKQRAHASMPRSSSFCFPRRSPPSGAPIVHALWRAAPLQSSAEASHIQRACWLLHQQLWHLIVHRVKTSRLTYL